MTFRRTVAALSDSHLFMLAWLLALTVLAALSFTAAAYGMMLQSGICALAAIAILAIVVWMNEVSISVRRSSFG